MTFRPGVAAAAVLTLVSAGSLPVAAQIRASERGAVSQTVDGTVITVDYARPQARGRESLFGGVVRAGETWTPGANWATTLEVSHDVRLEGREVGAGKYSLWITTEEEQWRLHLHRNPRLFHTQHPALDEMAVSLPVRRDSGPHMEILTFDFPRVGRDSATLRLRWGTVVVPVQIVVQPTLKAVALSAEEVAPYLGSYVMSMEMEPGKTMDMQAEIIHAAGSLRGIIDAPWGAMTMEFLPTGEPHRFLPAFMDQGEIVDVEEVPVIFEVEAGRARGFRIMGIGEDVWVRARRKD